MKKKIIIVFVLYFLFCDTINCNAINPVKSHKDTSYNSNGWLFGMNFGCYFANKKTANYYNGSGINNLSYTIIHNRMNYDSLVHRFKEHNFFIDTNSLPQNMKYDAAINIGFHFRKMFKNQFSIFFETDYSKLKTIDLVIIHVEDNSFGIPVPDEDKAIISGEEERIDINAGLSQEFVRKKISPFASIGVNMNNVKVLKSQVQIQGMILDLQNPTYAMYNIKQGGIGFGVFGCIGVDIKFGKNGMMNFGWNFSYKRINLTESEKPLFNSIIYGQILLNAAALLGNDSDK
jgi:hypothetical protein